MEDQDQGRVLAGALAQQKEDALKEFANFMEETVPLPSGGICYKSGSSFVKVRPMRGVEEDVLTNQKLVRNGKAFDILLTNCVTDWNGIELNELLYGDMNTIFAAIRTISLGSDYNVTIGCEECGEKQKEVIDMHNFKLKMMEIEPSQNGRNIFQWKSKNGFLFTFKFLTNGDNKVLQEEERVRKFQKKVDYESSMTDIICQMILSIKNPNGTEITSRLDIKKVVKEYLDIESIKEFADYINETKPDYDMTYHFECTNCSAVFDSAIPITTEFFWPKSRS